MSSINLLPWRENAKKIRNRKFYVLAGFSVAFGLMLVILAHVFLNYRTEVEKNNIAYLQSEQNAIVGKVKEIQGLQENKTELLNRMKVIQSLQNDRVIVAKLLDILPRILPEGIYMSSLNRTKDKVVIEGYAHTNAEISRFLKNIEDSPKDGLFNDLKLTEVKANKDSNLLSFRVEFVLGMLKT